MGQKVPKCGSGPEYLACDHNFMKYTTLCNQIACTETKHF